MGIGLKLSMRNYKVLGIRKIALGLWCSLIVSLVGVSQYAHSGDWVYTVRKGDTLWGLCLEYTTVATCWQKIGPYNGVEYPRSLAPGTRINFPVAWLIRPPAPALVTYVKGSAEKVLPSDVATALEKGDALPMGTRVLTGSDGLVLLTFADGSVMTVEGESELTLDALSGHKDTGMVDTRVHLKKGAVQTRVPKRESRSNFEVSTPSSVAAVRGTDFRVSSIEGEQTLTRNEVFSGAVSVANVAEKKELARGTGLVAIKDQPLPEVVKLLSAPTLLTEANTYPRPFNLQWEPLDGAQRYRLELVADRQPESVGEQKNEVTIHFSDTQDFTVAQVPDGCYLVRVSAVDVNSLQGMPSERRYCVKTLLAQPQGLVFDRAKKSLASLSWHPVERAESYRVEFSSEPSFERIGSSAIVAVPTLVLSDGHKDEKYARVVALAENEGMLESEPSEAVATRQPNPIRIAVIVSWVIAVIALL